MSPADDADDAPAAHPLGLLLGTWRGEGRGEYPTIAPFGYTEEITFVNPPGKPFLAYTQRTTATDDGRPLHAESGYWRAPAPDRVELVLAHATGLAELYEGTVAPTPGRLTLELRSTTVARTSTAKDVTLTERTFVVTEAELHYTMRMAAVGVGLTHHLAATLHRAPSP